MKKLKSRPPEINENLEAFIEGAELKKLDKSSSNKVISKKKENYIPSKKTRTIDIEELTHSIEDNTEAQFFKKANKKEIEPNYPWEGALVRTDVKKVFSLRLPEPEMLKLQFIQQKTDRSMQKFCLSYILPDIEKEVNRLVLEEIKSIKK